MKRKPVKTTGELSVAVQQCRICDDLMELPRSALSGNFQFQDGIGIQFCYYHENVCTDCARKILGINGGHVLRAMDRCMEAQA